jgi:hypothetical protein
MRATLYLCFTLSCSAVKVANSFQVLVAAPGSTRRSFSSSLGRPLKNAAAPDVARSVPANQEGKPIKSGWEFHYEKWISDAAAYEKTRSGATTNTLEVVEEETEKRIVPSRSLKERCFQLESKEQGESICTEVTLNSDGSVTVGRSEGPLFSNSWGTWEQRGGQFIMNLAYEFEGGSDSGGTRVGKFGYVVERTYLGALAWVGAKLGTEGAILCGDEVLEDAKLGYFHMIDTTDELQKRCFDSY